MNQILTINKCDCNKYKKAKKYLHLFLFSSSTGILLLFILLYRFFWLINHEKTTQLIKNKYNILNLYSSNANYTSLKLSNNINIIGSIEIPKINISYPIIENTNEELLKLSVCRFNGPLPNRIGNLCLAGHNYKNNSMFSNLVELKIGDSFFITDLNNTKLEYLVYNRFVVKENNLSCTKNSNNVEVTLITCNTLNNSERIVVKAKMKG